MKNGPRDRTPYVAVIGPGTATGALYERAREVGRLVAERSGVVVCGGLSGAMEAAARGAAEAGGIAIGILPDEDRVGPMRTSRTRWPPAPDRRETSRWSARVTW